jgi:hypothetical protein
MKNILYRNRGAALLKQLKEEQPAKYLLIKKVISRAIRHWKDRKMVRHRNAVVSHLVLRSLNIRILDSMGKMWLAARKIEKVAKWLSNEQNERLLQLRSQWKRSLLLFIKPTPSFENKNPTACREELNYKLPVEKPKQTKLATAIKDSPICHLRLSFPVSIY